MPNVQLLYRQLALRTLFLWHRLMARGPMRMRIPSNITVDVT